MNKKFPLILIIGFYLLIQTEGCGRAPSQPNPVPTTPSPNENTTALPQNHRLPCTENETLETRCLNGGKCFATYVEYRTIQCACPQKYIGDRCQMIDPTIIFGIEDDQDKVTKAGLAAGLTALILFLTVLIFILIWHKRYKRRKENERAKKEELKTFIQNNGDLNNGNYKPSRPLACNRDSYVETIPLTTLPLNQNNEIHHEEKPSQNEETDSQKLLFSSIQYADEDDSGASATFV